MFDKILIASRGEVALRVHRACHEMGIQTVAVHSTADADAMHVRLADEAVCIGPPNVAESYLNMPAILSAAQVTDSDAIHPGYGLLSENARFAAIVEEHGLTFIGPTSEHIGLMGDKIAAKETMRTLGVPVVAGGDKAVEDEANAARTAEQLGYPVLIKAAAGGGGRGMKIVDGPDILGDQLAAARTEAKASFGDDTVYIERFLTGPRHVEVQVLADEHGGVIHLGERDCSLQRRHQKILEEAPSPALNADEREAIGRRVVEAVMALGYRSLGTVEFLYQDGEFFFIEMNTRLQVEHPVTEMITGIDLVREQIRIAAGAPLGYGQDDVRYGGHAIECRINAEDPLTLVPSPGQVTDYHAPGGLGVRVDSALYSGYRVPPYYDNLIAKLITHGTSRNECLMRMRRALDEYVIDGIKTTIPLHLDLLGEADFMNGAYDINWLERYLAQKRAE